MQPELEHIRHDPNHAFACFRRTEPSFAFAWHRHAACELTLITAGSGRRFVGDHIEPYEPGDLVLLGSNLPHTWQSTSDGLHSAVVVQFHADFLGEEFWGAPEMRRVGRMLERAATGLRFRGKVARRTGAQLQAMPDQARTKRLLSLLGVLADLSEGRPERLTSRIYDTRPSP
ncbi:MAG: cupin domain-containing protein, partial [Rhodospirillales bacterium]|nr:cupin domain-containing protein [Rhodospirillales bacterium]